MNKPEEKNSTLVNALKDAAKKVYEKPEKTAEQENIAGKSACGKGYYCGALVRNY